MTPGVPADVGPSLRKLAALELAAFAILVPLSYGLAPISPRGQPQPREHVVMARAAQAVVPPGADWGDELGAWVTGRSVLRERPVRAVAYGGPLLLATLAAAFALGIACRRREAVHAGSARFAFRAALAFAAVSVLAYPILTQDLWLSVAWGRTVAVGENPYYVGFAGGIAGLPLEGAGLRMTYGPLWALLAGGLSWLAAGRVWLELALFKLAVAGFWVLGLVLVRRAAARRSHYHETCAVLVFGWLPLSVQFGVAEAHNDVVMVALMAAWLHLTVTSLERHATLALVASALVKYVTAPLLLLELLRRRRDARDLVVLGASVGLVALCFAPFYRGPELFDAALRMRGWEFWTPALAMTQGLQSLGLPAPSRLIKGGVLLGLGLLVVYQFLRFLAYRSLPRLALVALAALLAVLLGGVGHVWPWFALWLIPACALAWDQDLSRYVLPLLLGVPFFGLWWLLPTDWSAQREYGVWVYMLILPLTLWAGRLWPRSGSGVSGGPRTAGTTGLGDVPGAAA